MSNDQTIEAAIQAAGANVAPRVTPEDVQEAIVEEHYFTASAALDAVRFGWLIADHQNANERQAARDVAERLGVMGEGAARQAVDVAMGRDGNGWSESLGLLTFCVLVLRNGFTVTGESACASPENFNVDIGRQVARQNAVAKVWPLLGYALRERLHAAAEPQPPVDNAHVAPGCEQFTCHPAAAVALAVDAGAPIGEVLGEVAARG